MVNAVKCSNPLMCILSHHKQEPKIPEYLHATPFISFYNVWFSLVSFMKDHFYTAAANCYCKYIHTVKCTRYDKMRKKGNLNHQDN